MAVYSDKYKYIFFANPNTASKAIARTLKEKLEGKRIPSKEDSGQKNGEAEVRAHHTTYAQLVNAGLMTEEKLSTLFKFTGVRNPFDQMVSKYVKHCSRLDNDPSRYPWLIPGRLARSAVADAEGRVKGKGKDASEDKATRVAARAAAKAEAEQLGNTLAVESDTMTAVQADFLNWLRLMDSKYTKVNKLENGPLDFLDRADYVIRFEALQEGFSEVVKRLGIPEPVQIIEYNITAAREEAPKKKKSYRDFYVPESQAIVTRMFGQVIERFDYKFEG